MHGPEHLKRRLATIDRLSEEEAKKLLKMVIAGISGQSAGLPPCQPRLGAYSFPVTARGVPDGQ
ncbi:MAG: hypothetical protein H7237_03695 [Alkalinema sp. FL-bin-369]|nr:hypothetical protein [Leptolyngbyaceae cyanobacterium LF-bin-369]